MTKDLRPIRVEGDIAIVTLTQGKVAYIDAADAHIVAGHNWYAVVSHNTFYAQRMGDNKKKIYLHRAIFGDTPLEVDHIDTDGLNNRRFNLRSATRAENARNQRTRSNNVSGFRGVSYQAETGKWRAQIRFGGKTKHLGCFAIKEDARAAYANASVVFHGDFGRTA